MGSDKRIKAPRRRGAGSIFQQENYKTKKKVETWTIQYYRDDPATGKRVQVKEYTGVTEKSVAQRMLNERLAQVSKGEQFETRRARAFTVANLYESLKAHTETHSRGVRAVEALGWRWKHLEPVFGNTLAANLTTDAITAYKHKRQGELAKNATINRELACLRRALNLGKQSTPPKVRTVPYIEMLKEDKPRQGFVEDAQYDRLVAEAKELWLRTFLELGYSYGWRRAELLNLRVRQVDLRSRTIGLDVGSTKNGEGREVAMTARVEELLKQAVDSKKPTDCVLTRQGCKPELMGKPISDFRVAWASLTARAGVPGLMVHSLRRSAAKALRRAGVPESVIMQTGGWKTASMFRRYAIVSSADQRDAVKLLELSRELARERERADSVSSYSTSILENVKGGREAKVQ